MGTSGSTVHTTLRLPFTRPAKDKHGHPHGSPRPDHQPRRRGPHREERSLRQVRAGAGQLRPVRQGFRGDGVYGEDFHFNIPTLKNMVLTCKVMDDDLLKDEKLGKCKIKLDGLGLSADPVGVDKKVDNKWFKADAIIYLKLSYSE